MGIPSCQQVLWLKQQDDFHSRVVYYRSSHIHTVQASWGWALKSKLNIIVRMPGDEGSLKRDEGVEKAQLAGYLSGLRDLAASL